jgi:hypothetical protein
VTEERKQPEKPEKKAAADNEDTEDEREDRDDSEESEDSDESDDSDESEDSDEEQAPVDAGPRPRRFGLWVLIVVTIVVVMVIFMRREPASGGAVGSVVNADLTLIVSDRNDVDCQAAKGFEKYHCGFTDAKAAFQIEEKLKLRPFFTVDRRLFLLPGLFQQSAIDQRAQSEPLNKPREQLKRFTAKCHLKLLGEIENVRYRWLQTAEWSPPAKVQVAEVQDCKIEG